MARARNIKPSFFKNDELAEIEPLGRLLFIGLWSLCDFKGELEWREKRVKAEILPYDNCDILELAINLDKSGFIRYYSSQGKMYVNVPSFTKHQNPHKNERMKGSEIPEYSEMYRQAVELKGLTINLDKSGLKPEDSTSDPADSCSLNPDSLLMNPDVKDTIANAPVDRKKSTIPYQQIADSYNEHLGAMFGRVRSSNTPVKTKIIKKFWEMVGEDMSAVNQYFYFFSFNATDHQKGLGDNNGTNPWKADFEFICRITSRVLWF